jgi:hypothetical protein
VAGLGGVARQSRDHAGLCRPWGRGQAKQRLCRAVLAWGHGLVEIVGVCGSLALKACPTEIL